MSWGCVVTRARAGGIGAEKFGHVSRAQVRWLLVGWMGYRAGEEDGELFDTWAEALMYALGEDKTDDRETE